ncbi:MAG: Tail Collar domain protein [Bacteroidetes bacterium]|nr:Tail Collar domain protein [Bacteroidota bacterium]
MDSNFIGEIRAFPYSFFPQGWLPCNGTRVSIREYQALFALIGTNFGDSDRQTYFTLPNLQGIVPVGIPVYSPNHVPGKLSGNETVTLTENNLPTHTHQAVGDKHGATEQSLATNTPGSTVFLSNTIATAPDSKTPSVYSYYDVNDKSTDFIQNPAMIDAQGNGLPHNNMMPYVPIQYCICATDGAFPAHD